MEHVPLVSRVAVVPETVQTVPVVDAKLTGRPELAVAERGMSVPTTWAAIGAKVIVWACRWTVKLRVTNVAAAYALSPACVA